MTSVPYYDGSGSVYKPLTSSVSVIPEVIGMMVE